MDPTTTNNENAAPAEAAPSPAPNPEKAAAAKELVAGILERMGVQAELTVDDRADGIHVSAEVKSGGEALGQGRRGGVVESMGYLVNKALNREEEGRKWIFIAVQGLAAEPAAAPAAEVDAALKPIAEELVAKAKKLGGSIWVGPVPAPLRGLQAALSGMSGVRVRSEGEGIHRRLLIEA